MTKGIVLDKCKDVSIKDNTFENLDVAIEATDTTGLYLSGNKIISKDSGVNQLLKKVFNSSLSLLKKKELANNIIEVIILGQKKQLTKDKQESTLGKVGKFLGKQAMGLLRELLIQATAGKILIVLEKLLK